MLDKMMEQSREDAPDDLTSLEERLEKEEYADRIEKFKGEIEAEIRRRLVADRGAEAMAKTLRKPLPEDVEFMHASRDEMTALKKSLQPLTRKLAARLARKRKHGRKGPLDFITLWLSRVRWQWLFPILIGGAVLVAGWMGYRSWAASRLSGPVGTTPARSALAPTPVPAPTPLGNALRPLPKKPLNAQAPLPTNATTPPARSR